MCLYVDACVTEGLDYRQWAVRHFGLWDTELPYLDQLIAQDPRNNSAWNHRFHMSSGHTSYTSLCRHFVVLNLPEREAVVAKEIE